MSNNTKSKKRILVVDDEPSVCQSLRVLLTRDGYAVQTAWSGAEALTILTQEPQDLVITDFTMSGMKGDALAQLIRQRWPDTGVIMLTGSADLLRAAATPLPGVDALIGKPFEAEELRKAIAEILAVREAGGGLQQAPATV